MNKSYYISEYLFGENHAGVKARNDAERIFGESGLKKLGLRFSSSKTILGYYIKNIIPTVCNKIKLNKLSGDTVFFQYPVTISRVFNKVIKKIAQKNRIVFLIHDVDYLRYYTQPERMRPEIEILNCADTLVCHNERMIERLRRDGVDKPQCISLELFDYLLDDKIELPTPHYGNDVCFAGNLDKSTFVDELANRNDVSFKLHLFGINYKKTDSDKIFYRGSYDPDSLVSRLGLSYGLVWDGPEINTCGGEFGQYTMFNNPHKLSLYLAAGLPVIVWRKAAIADFVAEHNIGFAVDKLSEIDGRIESIDEKEYCKLVDNVREIQANVLKGHYLKNAINKVIG